MSVQGGGTEQGADGKDAEERALVCAILRRDL